MSDDMEDWERSMRMRVSMDLVFESAKWKAVGRSNKPGNTWEPWLDFSEEHLNSRLQDEIEEFYESREARELLDIINMAAFLFLRKTIHREDDAK